MTLEYVDKRLKNLEILRNKQTTKEKNCKLLLPEQTMNNSK